MDDYDVIVLGTGGAAETGQQLLTYEPTLPHAIMVNRFTNEAANYNAFGAACHEQDTLMGTFENLPCWLVFDQTWLDRYGLGGTEKASTDWIPSADTPEGLAEKLGIRGDALRETIERFNANARELTDPDFNRGCARVLDLDGNVIEGLYAAGNVAARTARSQRSSETQPTMLAASHGGA